MMSSRHTVQSSDSRSAYLRLLLQGIGWAGGLSLLGGGVTLAQTADPAASVPSAQDLLAPAPAAQPEPVVRSQPEVARPEAVAPIEAPRPAPVQQVERPRREAPAPAPAPVVEAPAQRPVQANPYIDTTDYSIGATQRDDQRPGSIVLSERSTGCQYTLSQGGSVPNSVCANRRIPAVSATASGTPAREFPP
ncbi:MAG: hypothetical protein HC895_09950 [Leptolyngbyaceae cyanobacterium SM1_3_5]|nr:hypothetical protein [Leptolyngbyaceae cyanobacterium SM1_3_5]